MKRTFLRLLFKVYNLQFIITRPIIIGVRVMLIRDEQVLLVKHSYQDGWLLPGGGVKRKESLEQAARRECREEVGANVGEMELVGIFTQYVHHKNDHIVLFRSTDFTITPQSDFEIERVEFFDMNHLPDDMMRGNKARIQEYLKSDTVAKAGYW